MSKTMDVESLHGKVIDYTQIKHLPIRNAFLDKPTYIQTNDKLTSGKQLLFMPNDLHEMHLQEKKYEKSKYNIVLFGVLLDGRRATVVLTGIKVYFEVMLPIDNEDTSELAMKIFNNLKQRTYASPESFEIIKGRQFKGYQKERRTFVKFYFEKLKVRCEAIKEVRAQGYETTADDTSSYYRVVCRDYLTSFSSWVYISEYTIKTYSSLRGPVYKVDIKNYTKCEEDITQNPLLAKDNIMTVCWDIETYSPDGQLPRPDNPEHKMFMIGITFQWHHSNSQLLRVCLVDHPCKPRPNYLTVVCGDEKKLIKAFGKLIFKMKPEFCQGFNDSDYDWPWLIKRGYKYPGVLTFLAGCFDSTIHWKNYDDEDIIKYNFKKEHVKIEADTYADGYTLVFPGYINIDVRTIFRQLYPTAEKSNLNFYLALNKLGGKKDMPYQELFRIYRELNTLMERRGSIKVLFKQYNGLTQCVDEILNYMYDTEYDRLTDLIAEVADYCVIDSQRCHELMKIRSVVMDRREVANLSYTSVFDSLYRANGMKVRNLVIARGQPHGIKFSNITNNGIMEDGKYPGAYVFPPKKGLVTSKLTMLERINHASLMKNYSEWLEVTPDELNIYYKIVQIHGACLSQEIINTIKKTYVLKKCFIDFLLENTGRPITGLDFSSLYPSLIMAYNLSPEYIITKQKDAKQAVAEGHELYKIKFMYNGRIIRGWSIRHGNKLDSESKDCKFGIYPMILKELFDTRSKMKKGLHKWESKKEKLDALSREEFNTPEIQTEYENVCFNYRYIDSKQKALKVFMNTFYGESGNKRSPFFVLQLAGAITTSGQDNIKMVQRFVEKDLCGVMYGDSVTGDTPILIKQNNEIRYIEIQDLVNEYKIQDNGKEVSNTDSYVWSDSGWTKIKKVIRHKTTKRIYRVLTHIGVVDCTEDHSLLNIEKESVKPSEIEIGVELLHNPLPNIEYSVDRMTKDEAFVWGMFVGDGSCGIHNCLSGFKSTWSINNQNMKLLQLCKTYLETTSICSSYKIHIMESSGVYKLVPDCNKRGAINNLVTYFRHHCYYKKAKIVPIQILQSSREVRLEFFRGYYMADCDKLPDNMYDINFESLSKRFDTKNKITALSLFMLVKSLGYNCSINTHKDKSDIYILTITKSKFRKLPNAIKKLDDLGLVNDYVYDLETESHHFSAGVGEMVVHNTDSLYLSMPESYFEEFDKKYFTGKIDKLEYWNNLINITFNTITPLKNSVNNMLKCDNGTEFLKMAFEESLFPVAFLAKKKYYGIPHISLANFQPKELFIRGLEVKKRGVSDVLKKVCMHVMWDSVSITNVYTLMQLVKKKIDEIYETDWDFKDFIMTDVFKPLKKNVKVQTFVARMFAEGVVIKPYERFSYVITKKNPFKYDERGRKKNLMIGEKMELAERASQNKMSIDLDYYMKGSINGQMSRLITYDYTFHVEPSSDELDDIKIAEDKTFANACKYVENYCGKFYTNYHSKGKIYQKIFRMANTVVVNNIKKHCGRETVTLLNSNYDIDNLEEWLDTKAEKDALKTIKGYGKEHVNNVVENMEASEKKKKIKELQDIYFSNKKHNLSIIQEKAFKERHVLLQRLLRDNLNRITDVLNYNTRVICKVSDKIKSIIDIDNNFNNPDVQVPAFDEISEVKNINEEDLDKTAQEEIENLITNKKLYDSLNKMRYIYINMLSNYNFIHKTRCIVDYLKLFRNKTIGFVNKPKDFDTKKYIKDNVDDILLEIKNNH
jgi:DNA polymerase elongation subunit (family B)